MPPRSAFVDRRLKRIGARQHGVVTRSQLVELGMSRGMIGSRLRSGRLTQLHRGVYGLGDLQGRLVPERARLMAAVLACGPGAALSHLSAGRLWRIIPKPRHDVDNVAVLAPRRIRRKDIEVRTCSGFSPTDVTRVDAIPVTTASRTLVDLATQLSPPALSLAVARAERMGLVRPEALQELSNRWNGRSGSPVLRAVLDSEGTAHFTRSEAEERFLTLIQSGGLPTPRTNVELCGYEVDFHWPAHRLVVEVDGFAYHRSRVSFERDRQRDARLTAAGLAVLRLTWRQITQQGPAALVAVAQALVQGGGRGIDDGGRESVDPGDPGDR